MSDVIDRITEVYHRTADNPPLARTAADVPWNYGAITEDWLTAILCGGVPGARVEHFDLGARDDGSSNRRRIRLRYNAAGQAADLPESVFCKSVDQLINRLMLGAAGTAQAEVFFYNHLRQSLSIEAPEAHFAAFDPQTFSYIVVLKDIADRVEFCDETTVINRARAESMVLLLADLHATFHAHPDLGTAAIPYRDWPVFWDNIMAQSPGWDQSSAIAIDRMGDAVPARLLRRRGEIWPCTDLSVRAHAGLPRTLLHSDVHLKNWYAAPGDRMGLSDWQIMAIGNWSRDFIYAMTTALTIDDRRAWIDDLLRLYLDRSAQHGIAVPAFDDAMRLCRQQMFTALAFWTVTLSPAANMPAMQPESSSRVFIERILRAIDDHDALDSFR